MLVSTVPSLLAIDPIEGLWHFLDLPWWTMAQWFVSMFVGILGGLKMLKTVKWQRRKDREYKAALKAEGQELRPWYVMLGRWAKCRFYGNRVRKHEQKEEENGN